MGTKKIHPQEVSTELFHSFMLSLVAPRPIAFASTLDLAENINLSPFSFFNVFGSKPPILIFSPSRRVRDNTTKHTLENCIQTKEVVINIGTYDLVEQLSLTSTEYDYGVNEFIKAGLTPAPSELVTPPRVKEAAAAFECKVLEIKPMGNTGGAANLIICEILLLHVQEHILDEGGVVDPFKFEAIARLGGDWYSRITAGTLFKLPKPNTRKGMGFDQLPLRIKNCEILSANNLARLANVEFLPTEEEINQYRAEPYLSYLLTQTNTDNKKDQLFKLAKKMLELDKVEAAWKILLLPEAS